MDTKWFMIGGGVLIVVLIIIILSCMMKKKATYTAMEQEDVDKNAKSWARVFNYPETNSDRMSPDTKMPTLSGLDSGGNVYVDEKATDVIGGVKAPLAWVL